MSKLTIEDAKTFIADVEKKREDWLYQANKSSLEIKKRSSKNKIWKTSASQRRKAHYPIWWSAFKVRQALVLTRLGIPIGKDDSGLDDVFGRTAAILLERLAKGIRKANPELLQSYFCVRDDCLVTNFGGSRAFYEREEVTEPKKNRLMQQAIEGTEDFQLIDEAGEVFQSEDTLEDEDGFYYETDEVIDVCNERVFLDHVRYPDFYIDPNAIRWGRKVQKIAFKYQYSPREYKDKFGKAALDDLQRNEEDKDAQTSINVFELWDKYNRKVFWFAENGEGFLKPQEIVFPKNDEETDGDDLYNLENFFPCVGPLVTNAPTDEFYPVTEYYQVEDVLDNIHNMQGRVTLLVKAIRIRFFFDSSFPELDALIGDAADADGIGISNLQKLISESGGTLNGLVAYFPVDEMFKALATLNPQLEIEINKFYQLTSIGEILRGQTSNEVEKTLGERQLEGKYASNRLCLDQEGIQEYISDNDMLLCEMALKNFSDESLAEYIIPQTLDPEDKARYWPSLELLKNDRKRRFRLSLETDSTVHINQEYQKAEATELANTASAVIEKIATTAEANPSLAIAELQLFKHLISQFSNGKQFLDEFSKTIEEAIDAQKQAAANPAPPPFDKDAARAQYDQAKLSQDGQLEQLKIQSQQAIEAARIARDDRLANLQAQLEQIKMGMAQAENSEKLQADMQKLGAQIQLAYDELGLSKEKLLGSIQKDTTRAELDQFKLMLDSRVRGEELSLAQAGQELEKFQAELNARDHGVELQERVATEQRLQEEHQINKAKSVSDMLKVEPPKPAPINLNIDASKSVKL